MAMTVRLPDELARRGRRYAAELGVSLNALLAIALREYLDRASPRRRHRLDKRLHTGCKRDPCDQSGEIERSRGITATTSDTYDLGFFDHETCRLEPVANRSSRKRYPCLRYKPLPM